MQRVADTDRKDVCFFFCARPSADRIGIIMTYGMKRPLPGMGPDSICVIYYHGPGGLSSEVSLSVRSGNPLLTLTLRHGL